MSHRKLLCAALLASTGLCSPLFAQAGSAPPPAYFNSDANGVDPVSGLVNFAMTEGSVGSGPGALSLQRIWATTAGWTDNWSGGVGTNPAGGTALYVQLGAYSDVFSVSGTTYTSLKADGSTLVSSSLGYTYTTGDGTIIQYGKYSPNHYQIQGFSCVNHAAGGCAIPISMTRPDGTVFTWNWDFVEICQGPIGSCLNGGTTIGFYRFRGVTSSAGYSFTVNYKTDIPGSGTAPQTNWYVKTGVVFANSKSTSGSFPTVSYAYPTSTTIDVTDALSRTWHFDFGSTGAGQLTFIKRPAASSNSTTITYSPTTGTVTQVVRDGVQTNYSRVISGALATTTTTGTAQPTQVFVADTSIGQVTKVTVQGTGQTDRVTQYGYDTAGRLTSITYPKGNQTTYLLDARGNVTKTTNISSTPHTPADIVTSASYPTSCTNPVTCNKPTSITDGNLNETDYTYDPVHGGVLTVTQPAVSGIHPQTRFSYTRIDSNGAPSATGTFVLSALSACRSMASCTGTADEVRSSLTYGANMLPASVSRGAGDGSLTATSSYTYDGVGNRLTVDGPLAGTADTTVYHYDADRELVGIVEPDPDGSGPLKNRAKRYSYNADGQVTLAEQGTVLSQSDPDWANFVSLQQVSATYDANARQAQVSSLAGGTTYSLVQYSYDAAGRLLCTAQRMTPSSFGPSLPDACTPFTPSGSFGPDRIAYNQYNTIGDLAAVTSGYGSAQARTERYTFNINGNPQTSTDGNGNVTNRIYDGQVRLTTVQFPSPTTPGQSNPSDFEQYGYDANGNVTSRQIRNGTTISYAYDALNRLTGKTLPTGTGNANPSYTYDLLGELLTANNANSSFQTTTAYSYDALGNRLSEASTYNGGGSATLSSQYDLASRRTRLTWSDGFYVTYDYDTVDEMTAIRSSSSSVLAAFSYDDLGERTARTLANGASTAYGYDPVSRLTALNLNGATNTTAVTLSSYSPANEIGSRTNSNDAFAWTQGANANRAYAVNGLNQYTNVGGGAVGYDPKGNLTTYAGATYTYGAENSITTGGGGSFWHDALQRLVYTTSASTRFGYDGPNIAAEYDASGAILRRYVFGPSGDEPIIWYEGPSTSDRRWMDADERGSITRITNDTGSTLAINSYDEFGMPATSNAGRFQYTGQAWLPEIGLFDYKARIFSPSLGRFFQTDPIGYDSGLNWYNYVGSDPINEIDPLGLDEIIVTAPKGGNCGSGQVSGGGSTCISIAFRTPRSVSSNRAFTGFQGSDASQTVNGNRINCHGRAYVLAGNPANVGQEGFPGVTVTNRSAAVIPRQWTGALTGGPLMRSIGESAYGTVTAADGRVQSFSGITQSIGYAKLGTARQVQDMIMARDPGALVIEIVGGQDFGKDATFDINLPDVGEGCPAGSR